LTTPDFLGKDTARARGSRRDTPGDEHRDRSRSGEGGIPNPPETCRVLTRTHVATLRRALKAGDEIMIRPPGYLVRLGPDDRTV
jgi:hypothetical protein